MKNYNFFINFNAPSNGYACRWIGEGEGWKKYRKKMAGHIIRSLSSFIKNAVPPRILFESNKK